MDDSNVMEEAFAHIYACLWVFHKTQTRESHADIKLGAVISLLKQKA